MTSKILISGANGFVGRSIQDFFGSVYAFETVGRSNATYSWNQLDKFNSQTEVYIHLAAIAQDLKDGEETAYEQVNVGLTQQFFKSFLKSEAELFIHFSTVKAIADSSANLLMEEDIPNPKTAYGQSKLKAEQFLLEQELPEGKRLIILRPTMIHGPGNSGSLLQLYKFVQKGIPYPFAAFSNQRSFLVIENLLAALKEIISKKVMPSGVYNICDDELLSTNELIELIAEGTHSKARLLKLPTIIFKSLAAIGDGLRLPFNSHILGKLTSDYKVSNQKLKQALGWEHMPVKSRVGILKTVKSFHADS